ncbi:MAG: glycosyltransferase [Alphaproteobacteria bacterium]|nr:glycosyltransferase [Alphaproteobacteria bacterium]
MSEAPARPVPIEGLGSAAQAELERALRAGASCTLSLRRPPPRRLRLDQLIPLFDQVQARSHTLQESLRRLLPPGPSPEGPRHRVTAIIPTNRGTPIGLQALRAQDCALEVLVLANGGVRPEGDRVLELPWQGHGPTRQRGVEAATGDYVLFTVDDALPRGAGCVRALVEALEDGGYDAVFGRQLPWPSADPITRERLGRTGPRGQPAPPRCARTTTSSPSIGGRPCSVTPAAGCPSGRTCAGGRAGASATCPAPWSCTATRGSPARSTAAPATCTSSTSPPATRPTLPSTPPCSRALPGALGPTLRAGPGELPNQLAELLGQWRAARLHAKGLSDPG